jgi:carbon-monoxide dehydrogenase small subunit
VTRVSVEVNGLPHAADVEPRLLLADFLRDHIQLTGTHIGCEHGVCGTCTVQVDGQATRSCLTLAVQVDGSSIRTVEGLAPPDGGSLHPLQSAFREHHALQCGYCTPGFLMSIEPLLPELRGAGDREVREQLSGNLCRCTGYQNIVEATQATVAELAAQSAPALERRTAVETTTAVPGDADRTWAAIQDPRGLLEELGVTGLAQSEPNSWRGRLEAGTATVDGVLELIDVDDDLRVANFFLAGRAVYGIGQVRGELTLSVDESTLAARLELELIGMAAVPSRELVQQRFGAAAAAWVEILGAGDRPRPGTADVARLRPREFGLGLGLALAAAGAAWLGWRLLRRPR